MNCEDTNQLVCPLHDQTGAAAIQDFTTIIAQLPPDLRTAFETERAVQQHELDAYLTHHVYRT